MATFQAQVEGLTGLSIGTSPTTAELSQFLKDGVLEVTNRSIKMSPMDAKLFTTVSSEQESNGLDINGAKIVSVVREAGANNDWRACSEIHPSQQGPVEDTGSLYLATTQFPVYTVLENGQISVFPQPDSVSSHETFKVYYVNNVPQDKGGAALLHSHSDIKYFADDKVYLVVLYAAIQSLLNSLSSKTLPDAVDSLSLPPVPVVPDLISDTVRSSVSFDDKEAPVYTSPVLVLVGAPANIIKTDLSIGAVVPIAPVLRGSDTSISFSTSVPTYTAPVVSPDFSDANTWLNTEEDTEMVTARLHVITGQLQEYQSNIQNEINKFNKENTQYQAELQEAIENARLSSQDDAQNLQKFGNEVQAYQAAVNSEVQEFQQNFQVDFQVWQTERTTDLQKYSADMQNELNNFNESNTVYQAELQISIQNAQLSSQDDAHKLQKYSSEIGSYQTDVNAKIQEFSNKIQDFNARLQKSVADYNWMENRYKILEAKYNTEFGLMSTQQGQ